MDELSYQLDVSETFTYSDEASSDENIEHENLVKFHKLVYDGIDYYIV